MSWNLSTISDTPLVGLANMGPTGIPGEKLHVFGRFHTPAARRVGTILSYTGITEYTCFTIFAACQLKSHNQRDKIK